MAERTGHNKPVTVETPREFLQAKAHWNKKDFDSAIYAQGYEIFKEMALHCACRNSANGAPLSDCKNCGGTGWIFIEKTSTRAVIQAINRQSKFVQKWTEMDSGTISVSLRNDDKVAFMDRITIMDQVSTFSQTVYLKRKTGSLWFARLFYTPKSIKKVYLFNGSDEPLVKIAPDKCYFQDNYFYLNMELSIESPSVSLRYEHHPQYHVIDITREQIANRGGLENNCDPNSPVDDQLAQFPVHAIARKADRTLDPADINGDSVYDNT